MFKLNLNPKPKNESIHEAFNISDERVTELKKYIEKAHMIKDSRTSTMQLFAEFCETTEELVWCAYEYGLMIAGTTGNGLGNIIGGIIGMGIKEGAIGFGRIPKGFFEEEGERERFPEESDGLSVDKILEKINEKGMDSLTKEEKEILKKQK